MAAFAEGTPCWLDVSLPDLEAGKRFYGALFGWTFVAGPDPRAYAEALSEGERVAGLVAKRDGRMPTSWGVYFATRDVAGARQRVLRAGGLMVREPVRVGRLGVVALAADPGGAVFGLWQDEDEGDDGPDAGPGPDSAPRVGFGFGRQGVPGSFCWTEVYTRAPEPVDAFYEEVLGVTGSDLPRLPGEEVPFRVWSVSGGEPGEDREVGGRSVITEAFPAVLPGHFLNYFAVRDCDATAAAVVRLGGRVREAPFDIPSGRMAALTDDQGADFAVLAERPAGVAAAGAEGAAVSPPAEPGATPRPEPADALPEQKPAAEAPPEPAEDPPKPAPTPRSAREPDEDPGDDR
ncbi:VOC family protein [Streptomyces montanisoli]|uniref:VOC family protein n=1 Tax=Streptomyces montanisoli TaxID=2798581 RepID=A0A940MJS9_9ACTN|nr:VOC family protein [Streptomyces montanisoli]